VPCLLDVCLARLWTVTSNSPRSLTRGSTRAFPEWERENIGWSREGNGEAATTACYANEVSVANFAVISLHDVIAGVLMLLAWSMLIEFGGLSMSPASIGLWVAGYGFLNVIFQFVAFPSAPYVLSQSTSCSPSRTWHHSTPVGD
jgi:hypothetical protein